MVGSTLSLIFKSRFITVTIAEIWRISQSGSVVVEEGCYETEVSGSILGGQ